MTIPRWGWIVLAGTMAIVLVGGTVWWLRVRSAASLPSLQPISAPVTNPTPSGIQEEASTSSVQRLTAPEDEPIFFLPEIPTLPTVSPGSSQNVDAIPPSAVTPPQPLVVDTDGDGLTDEQEANAQTSPTVADTDTDTLSDGDEVKKYRTDPLKKDSDGDGYTDAQEIENGYNPVGTGKCLTTGCIF